jgi:hypothetical protein
LTSLTLPTSANWISERDGGINKSESFYPVTEKSQNLQEIQVSQEINTLFISVASTVPMKQPDRVGND